MVFCCTRRCAYQPPLSQREQDRSLQPIRSSVPLRNTYTAIGVSRPVNFNQSVLPQSHGRQSMLPPTTQGTHGTVPAFPQGPYNRYLLLRLTSRSKLETYHGPSTDSNSPATSDPRYPVSLNSSPREIQTSASSLESFGPFRCYRTTSSKDPFWISTPNVDSPTSWNAYTTS